jgi:arsenate reductase (thioredoxin)
MAEPRTVVFVCEHGAAKSVIAAALLERLAANRGAPVRALARGIEPEPQVSVTAAAGLLAEGIDVRGWQPRPVTSADLASAWRIVSFGPDLRLVTADPRVEHWHDVPPVSERFEATRAAILVRLPTLLDRDRQCS